MAASPSTALLGLPPLRPSPSKQPSFGRTASSHNVHHSTASASSSMMPGGSSTGTGSSHSATQRRARSSSIVSVQEVPETYDDQLDQGALTNVNAEWVNSKGAWLIHVVLIALAIVLLETIPGMSQDLTWSIVNLGYLFMSYVIFHYVTGVPFDMTNNSGVYDNLTLWEQIDSGAQYTPAKKWLTTLPIVLFLVSTHYTRYDSHPALFTLNLCALLFVGLAPKLPAFHRLRIKFFDAGEGGPTPDPSAPPTPRSDDIVR
ncbi:hypothetical protein B0A53_03101 [Rhodotorula sp. CCFEE 5036]|nr:hypothetical protein B0A53_03101 [Rhodotorula sp. CCFEE 5036]